MDRRTRRALAGSLVALAAVSTFFLIRPFAGPLPPYGPRPPGTTYAYNFVVLGAFVPYALAAWASRSGVSLRLAVGGTALLAALLLPAAVTQSQDVYGYLFYGKLWVVHGANPYVVAPEAFDGDPWYPWLLWRDQPTVYGPLWTLVSGTIARTSAGSIAVAFALMKLVSAALLAAAVAGLARVARDRDQDPGRAVVLFGWNPLVLLVVPLGAHNDIALAAAALWAIVLDARDRPILAAALLAAGALVKAYAALLLLVYLVALWMRRGPAVRAALLCGGMGAAAFAPFWAGLETFEGVIRVAGRSSSSLAGLAESWLDAVLPAATAMWGVRAAGLAVVATVVVAVARRPAFAADPWPGATAALAAFLVVSPWYLYWYAVPVLALAIVASAAPLRAATLAFSGTSILTASGGGTPWGVAFQTVARYGTAAAVGLLVRRKQRGARTPGAGTSGPPEPRRETLAGT